MEQEKSFLFVLKDKGTRNQGWWLKIQTVDELNDYYEIIIPTKYGNVFENYMYGSEWNDYHPDHPSERTAPHENEKTLTDAVLRYGSKRNYNILQSIQSFRMMVATNQMEDIRKYGAIYINARGGYYGRYKDDKEYAFVRRKNIIFPSYKKEDIRIKKFPYGSHYYAYIGDLQVKDGDISKWNTYEEAYRQAEQLIEVN